MKRTTLEITGWEFIGYEVTATTKERRYAWSTLAGTEETALQQAEKARKEGYNVKITKKLYANLVEVKEDDI